MNGTALDRWRTQGRIESLRHHDVFAVDMPPSAEADAPPVLLLHGFPTASYDWRLVAPKLRQHRRVLTLDFLGFGWSAKPDRPYRLAEQADLAQSLVASRGVDEVDLVTHDMGDTVGGELLAREIDGELPFRIRRRVVTNGSIYIDEAVLRIGQRLPIGLPRRLLDQGLTDVFGPSSPPPPGELDAQWQLMRHAGGDRLMPRLVRYIEERRARERRFTGAIEQHLAPCLVIWGRDDPVAVPSMATRLVATARAATELVFIDGVGHFPMVSAADEVAERVVAWLDET